MTRNNNQPQDRTIGYKVREIMTPVDDLYCLTDDTVQMEETLQKAKKDVVTYLPKKQGEQITGIVRRDKPSEVIRLTADWLIAVDTPILHLLELFAEKNDRVFLVLQSSKIIGLVAPADLNKVPARASMYLLMAQFEDDLVRHELNNNEDELAKLLSATRIQKLRTEYTVTQKGDVKLGLFYHLYLADLFTIVAKHEGLRKRLGFRSRTHADEELDFADIRDRVCHLTGMLINSREEVETIDSACSTIIRLSATMNKSGNRG